MFLSSLEINSNNQQIFSVWNDLKCKYISMFFQKISAWQGSVLKHSSVVVDEFMTVGWGCENCGWKIGFNTNHYMRSHIRGRGVEVEQEQNPLHNKWVPHPIFRVRFETARSKASLSSRNGRCAKAQREWQNVPVSAPQLLRAYVNVALCFCHVWCIHSFSQPPVHLCFAQARKPIAHPKITQILSFPWGFSSKMTFCTP